MLWRIELNVMPIKEMPENLVKIMADIPNFSQF